MNIPSMGEAQRSPEWRDIFNVIMSAGTTSRDVFGKSHQLVGGLGLQQDVYELTALVLALRQFKMGRGPDFKYLEIGSASGGTAKLLHQMVGFTEMASIDLPQGDVAHIKYEVFKELPIKWTELDSKSYEAVKFIADNKLGPFDVVFIDGDHYRSAVLSDIMMYRAFCAPGAIMVFHDAILVNDGFGVRLALDLVYQMGVLRHLVQYAGQANLGVELAEVLALP